MQDQLHILVVDNDAFYRQTIKRVLRTNYPAAIIQEAITCADATQTMALQQFDCVLLDYHLPDASGMSCLVDIREAGSSTPIIILAGQGDEKIAAETIRAGATDYLPKKGLTPQLLAHCLRGALRYHQAQEQIRQTQEALQLRDRAIAAASNGIVIADPHQPDCPIIYVNPAFSAITGYPPEEVIGRNCRFLQGKDTDEQYIQQVRDCLQQESTCQIILRNYKKDGTPLWNELSISPVRDADGALTHFIGVQTDITERRDAEDALRVNVARQQGLLRDMFSSVTEGKFVLCASEADLPEPYTPFAEPVSLSRTSGVRELRRHTLGACIAAGIPDERRYDLETAVGEAAMNAVVHAATGTGHVFLHGRGAVQVRVEDEGKGIAVEDLPNATLKRGYTTAGSMGHGFKMILQLVDKVFLLTGVAGTIVVLEQERTPKAHAWF